MICKKKPRANYLFAPNRELNFQLLTYVPCFMSRNCCYSSALARGTGQVSRLERIIRFHSLVLFSTFILRFRYSGKATKIWKNLFDVKVCIIRLDHIYFEKSLLTSWQVEVNLCQKLLFFHQLTHIMTTDCSWNYEFSTWKLQVRNIFRTCAEHAQKMLCTQTVF